VVAVATMVVGGAPPVAAPVRPLRPTNRRFFCAVAVGAAAAESSPADASDDADVDEQQVGCDATSATVPSQEAGTRQQDVDDESTEHVAFSGSAAAGVLPSISR
jgi:hypothetical protein